MFNHKPVTLATLCIFIAGLLSSCTIKNATDMRNKMASDMAPTQGLRTIWNTTTPLTLGHVYIKRPDIERGGYSLFQRYERFESQANSPNYKSATAINATWKKDIDSWFSLKPQLGYMGLSGSPNLSNTKTIRFSADAHELYSIKEFDAFVSNVLNSPGTGPELRKKVYEDTQRLNRNDLPVTEAKYWIVTDMMTFKNLSVDFHAKPSTSVEASVADIATLKQFMQIKGLTVEGMANASSSADEKTTVKSVEPVGLIAWCVPLTATKKSNGHEIIVNEGYPLELANTLK